MAVAPHDDPEIEDDDGLVRFVPGPQIIYDGNMDCYRPSSASFDMSSSDGCMSVDIESELIAAGLPPEHNLSSRPEGSGAVRLSAGIVRTQELSPFKDPEPANPYHGQIANLKSHGSISKGKKKALSRAAEWIFNPME